MPLRPDSDRGAPRGGIAPAPEIILVRDAAEITEAAAAAVAHEARAAVDTRGRFLFALNGGSTPAPVYRRLAGPLFDHLPWSDIHLLWGDERCVPPDDDRSNYAVAAGSGLLGRAVAGVYRMRGEDPPEVAAASYAAVLAGLGGRDFRPAETDAVPSPEIDLVLLGLGEDGHTASLFPGSPALLERRGSVVATEEHAGLRRLTLTLPVLLAARRVLFLVAGESKREVVRRVLCARDRTAPATLVFEGGRRVAWMMDAAAGGGEGVPQC